MYSAVPAVSADPDVRLGGARAPGGEGVLRPGQGPGAAGDQLEPHKHVNINLYIYIFQSRVRCGERGSGLGITGLIGAGEATSPGMWPWVALLQYNNTEGSVDT